MVILWFNRIYCKVMDIALFIFLNAEVNNQQII